MGNGIEAVNGCRFGNGCPFGEGLRYCHTHTPGIATAWPIDATAWAELTASQRAQAIKRRRQIWEALHPEEIQVGKVCPPESATGYKQPPPQEKGFAASTAAVSGESKRAINQHLARADALGDDLERITGTSQRVEGNFQWRKLRRSNFLHPIGARRGHLRWRKLRHLKMAPPARAWKAPCPLAVT